MAKTIKDRYDEDPSAGNDPATSYKVAADKGDNTPVSLDMDQMSAAVSFQTNQFSPVPTTVPPTVIKDPDVDGTLLIEWDEYLQYPQELVGAVWTLESGLTEDANFISTVDSLLIYSGGVVDTTYSCSCEITYVNTQTDIEDTKTVNFTVSCLEIAALDVTTSTQLINTFYI